MNSIPVRIAEFSPGALPPPIDYYTKTAPDNSGLINVWNEDPSDAWKIGVYGLMSPVDHQYRLLTITHVQLDATGSYTIRLRKYPIMRFALETAPGESTITVNFLE